MKGCRLKLRLFSVDNVEPFEGLCTISSWILGCPEGKWTDARDKMTHQATAIF